MLITETLDESCFADRGNFNNARDFEKGAVTAELATTLPAVMALLAVVIALAAAFGTQFRVSDAARTGARLAAIGAEYGAIRDTVIGIVGSSPAIEISRADDWATVQVRQSIRVGPVWLGPLTVTASATSWLEP